MLAGDLPSAPSEFYNYVRPIDVNNDGNASTVDLLILVNSITATGPRSLAAIAPASVAGEGDTQSASSQKFYIDPNNDQMLNSLDLLTVINEMSGEGEDPPILANFKFVPVALGTNTPITSIPEGGHYELRVLVQDTGVQDFNGEHRNPLQPNGNDLMGLFSAFVDMTWDRAQTDLQVNETQTFVINGSPSATTRFTLTFTDIDNTTQTTGQITFVPGNGAQTAVNIRNALVALSKIGNSAVGALPNVDVVAASSPANRAFTVRFINDKANKNFQNLSGNLTVPGGATTITIDTSKTIEGDPNSLVSFQEMFRPRPVLDSNFEVINDDPNTDLLYYTLFVNPQNLPFALPQPNGATRTGGDNAPALVLGGPRPGTREVELFRLRMTAKDKLGTGPVTFNGAYPDVSSGLAVSLLGFNTAIPANTVNYVSGTLNIIEPVSAIDDAASLDEGTNGGSNNNVLISVLANDVDNTGPANLVLSSFTQPAAGTGTVTQVGSQLRYTVPNADFNGVVTFQYTIRDGVNAALTDVGTVTVTVNATNDAPVNSVPGAQTVAEDAPAGLVFGGGNAISISDVDAGAASVSIRLQSTNGTLSLPALPPTLTITGDGTNDLTIQGSIANINPALSGLKYTPNQHYNGPAQITVTTNDNGNTGKSTQQGNNGVPPDPLTDIDVIAINVTATNDAPVNSVPGAQSVDEMVFLTFNTANGNLISVSDIDAGATGSTNPNLTVTLSTTQGGVLHATTGGGAAIGGQDSTNLTISGTVVQVNAALNGMTYRNASPATDILTVFTSDNGNTGAGGAKTDSDPITIEVLPTTRPRAITDIFPPIGQTIFEPSGVLLLDVLANDLSHTGETKFLVSVDQPSGTGNGTTAPVGDLVQYTPPDADFFGTVTFTYTMNETDVVGGPSDGPSTATVTLTITNTNDNPIAAADPYSTNEGQTLVVSNPAAGVLNNDSDPDNRPGRPPEDTLTAELIAGSAVGGTVNLSANGTFTFVPTPDFNGAASFSYRVLDGKGGTSSPALVSITVAPVDDAPVANPDSFNATEDVVLNVPAPGVLVNDTDADNLIPPPNAGLTALLTAQPPAGQGTVALASDGSFVWTPTPGANFNGQTTFRYRAVDPTPLQSPETTVTIQVAAVNDTPVAGDREFTVEEGAVLTRNAAQGLRTAVTDVDEPGGFTGVINKLSDPAQGVLQLNTDGSFTYTPPAVVVNPFDVTFTYSATDNGLATSNTATVTIHVTPFNDPPVAVADGPYTATEDQTLTVSAALGVIPNDSDEETPDSGLTAILVTNVPAAAGSVALNADGSFTYSPPAAGNFFTLPGSPISFTYKVNDGGKDSNVVSVTINVNEINDDPVANDDLADPIIKGFANQLLPSALTNDNAGVDAGANPGDVLSIILVGGSATQTTTGAGATVRRVGNDLFYDASPSFTGQDSFQYTISDGRGGTATATYVVNVVDFIPKDISGTVLVDGKPLAGVEIHLNGTGVLGIPVFAQLVTFTDELGHYSFDDLRPGNYTVTEITPRFLKDGSEPASHPSPLVTSIGNDQFTLNWDTPLSISTGAVTGLDFNELRIDVTQLDDSSGFIQEILASSGPSGMLLAVGPGNTVYWSYCLPGWNTLATVQLEFGAGGSIPSLLLTIGGVTKRIYQDPHHNTGSGSPSSPPAGSLARFRILGSTNSGEYIIRLDGTLSSFGFASTAGSASAPPEGEEAPQMSDGEFRDAADHVFAEKAWA